MTTALRRPEPVTIEAFDKFVEAQADAALFELVEGVIVMMTNPDRGARAYRGQHRRAVEARHGRAWRASPSLAACACSARTIPRETDKTRPDVVVRCGALETTNYITDPLVVIEVLSPSTMDTDRGPSSTSTSRCRPSGTSPSSIRTRCGWSTIGASEQGFELDVLKAPEEVLHLEAVAFRIDLARIYFGVTL